VPLFQCPVGRNSVDFLRVVRNGEAFRFDNKTLVRKKFPPLIMKLPCQLYQPGPVVKVRYGSIIISRKTRCFGVKNDVHEMTGLRYLNLRLNYKISPGKQRKT